MKKQRILWSLLVVFLACGLLVYAAESQPDTANQKPKVVRPPRPRVQDQTAPGTGEGMTEPPVPQRIPGGLVRPDSSMSPQEGYRGQVMSQEMLHMELIKELTEIKKIADEEGAVKTSEAIQKLIDKRNLEYRQSIQAREKRRLEMQKRIEERMKARQQRTAGPPPAKEADEQQPAGQNQPDKKATDK